MKNALILFAINFPFFLIQLLPPSFLVELSSHLQLIISAWVLFSILKKDISKHEEPVTKNEAFTLVFKNCLSTGFFYGLWMGAYYFFLFRFIKTEELKKLYEIAFNSFKAQNKVYQNNSDFSATFDALINSPFFWIFYGIITYCFIFSLLGITFGLFFKFRKNT